MCKFNCHEGWLREPEKDYSVPCPECNPEMDQALQLEPEYRRVWGEWVQSNQPMIPLKIAKHFFFAGAAVAIGKGNN